MPRFYSATNSATNTASATVPMYTVVASTSTRGRVYDVISASSATPTENAAEFALRRISARGTQSTTVTANPLDPADPAALLLYDTAWSVNPTITANSEVLTWAQNHRTTLRWVSYPGSELVVPATSGAGFALVSVSTTTAAAFRWTTFWQE